jgi:hypothetical protein
MEHAEKKRETIWGDDLEEKGFRAENGLVTNGRQYVDGIAINDREGVYAVEDIDWIGFPFVAEPEVNIGDMEPVDVYELPVEGAFSDAKLMDPEYELGQDEDGYHVIYETTVLMWQGCRFIHKQAFEIERRLDQLLKSIAAMKESISGIERVAPYVADHFMEWLDEEKKFITEGTLSDRSVKHLRDRSMEGSLEKSLDTEGFRNRREVWKHAQENIAQKVRR